MPIDFNLDFVTSSTRSSALSLTEIEKAEEKIINQILISKTTS